MATARVPKVDDVLRVLRHERTESHYDYAPGRISFVGILAQLAIAGFPRRGATEAALRMALDRLVAEGAVKAVEVVGPTGEPDRDWYELAL